MTAFFACILLYYFLGVKDFLQMSNGYSDQTMGIINIMVITLCALLYYHFQTHETSRQHFTAFGKRIYTRLHHITAKYLFVLSLVCLVLATVAQLFRPIDTSYVGQFFAAWVLCLVIVRDAFWDAKIYFGRHLFLHKESIFRISVALVFMIVGKVMIQTTLAPLIGIIIGMIVYISIIKGANVVRGYSVRRLFPTRLYLVAGILTAGVLLLNHYPQIDIFTGQTRGQNIVTTLQGYRSQLTDKIATIAPNTQDNDTISVEEGIIGTGVLGLTPETTGTTAPEVITGTIPTVVSSENAGDLTKLVSFTEALQHLFETYNIPLSSAKNVRFSHIASSDERYALFKTAHEKSMLGSSINPDARVRCDVYMVMKGIVAGWTITGQGNVFDKYRQTANTNNAINGCVRDGFVSVGNL